MCCLDFHVWFDNTEPLESKLQYKSDRLHFPIIIVQYLSGKPISPLMIFRRFLSLWAIWASLGHRNVYSSWSFCFRGMLNLFLRLPGNPNRAFMIFYTNHQCLFHLWNVRSDQYLVISIRRIWLETFPTVPHNKRGMLTLHEYNIFTLSTRVRFWLCYWSSSFSSFVESSGRSSQ